MIQDNWQSLVKPNDIKTVGEEKDHKGTYTLEPLERGYGMTLGNSLRRVLLSSLQGAAVTAIKIEGVDHEFSSIEGVREDVTEIILNIKMLALKFDGENPHDMSLKAKGPCTVTAGMIETAHDIEIMNKDLVICTLDKGAELNMELKVGTGKGYVPYSDNRKLIEDMPQWIPVDSIYSPVSKVQYDVENARVGDKTDYDKLTITVETNGAVTPRDAIGFAARILVDQLKLLVNFDEPEEDKTAEKKNELPFPKALLLKVDELELSVRSANCLKNDKITYLGDLVQKSEQEMLRTPNFGRKSLNEIKSILKDKDLELGKKYEGWADLSPEDKEALSKEMTEDQF